jgi:tetratricopeptide (TPR) repeat protein
MCVRFARIVPLIMLFAAASLPAQSGSPDSAADFDDEAAYLDEDWPFEQGDSAIAEKYLIWAENAIAMGRWSEARAALERAVDFADISSDISYLLALARSHEDESRRAVLESLQRAIGTKRWNHYTEAHARLMEADQLITLRRYSSALDTLAVYRDIAGETADAAILRLAALKGLVDHNPGPETRPASVTLPVQVEFRRRLLETMDNFPRDSRPLRILFDYARVHEPERDDLTLLEIALRRLPFLLETDQELAWMAAPFINDIAEARRLVAAYRAGSLRSLQSPDFMPHPASIIQALNLGLIADKDATDELFAEPFLDSEHIIVIGALLRSEEERNYFAEKLHSFSGTIIEDADHDDHPEGSAVYHQGSLQEYYYDVDQDGVSDMFIVFNAGTPQQAVLTMRSLQESGGLPMFLFWERYPLVHRAVLDSEIWLSVPGGFSFAPVIFEELGGSGKYAGLLFPRRNSRSQSINRRILSAYSASVQRPSVDFSGGVEQIFLNRGIPVRAEVTLNDTIVSVTEFQNGYPVIERADMDLDGRMETVRHFDKGVIRAAESDWYGDGIFGSAELYREDGSVVYSWDLDGDGTREYSERR